MKTFHIDILTPFGTYYSGDAEFLNINTGDFVLGILPNHTPLITKVCISEMSLTIDGNKVYYAISDGVLNIKADHTITLLVNSIERADEIDVTRASTSKLRAEKRLAEAEHVDVDRAKKSLERANIRLAVSLKK